MIFVFFTQIYMQMLMPWSQSMSRLLTLLSASDSESASGALSWRYITGDIYPLRDLEIKGFPFWCLRCSKKNFYQSIKLFAFCWTKLLLSRSQGEKKFWQKIQLEFSLNKAVFMKRKLFQFSILFSPFNKKILASKYLLNFLIPV